jgi:enoyl-CoA hydratase/carnithine racemase
VNGPALVHCEYALLADVVIASDTTVFADMPHLGANIAPGDGLFVVWEEVLGLNRARHLQITQSSFTAQQALDWGAVAEVVPLEQRPVPLGGRGDRGRAGHRRGGIGVECRSGLPARLIREQATASRPAPGPRRSSQPTGAFPGTAARYRCPTE